MISLPLLWLVINYIVIYDFCGSAADVIHPNNPLNLIICFELFSNALTFCHLFYESKKHILSSFVNVREITVQLTACQQIDISHLVILLDMP